MNKILKIKTVFFLEFSKIKIVKNKNAIVVHCERLFGKLV